MNSHSSFHLRTILESIEPSTKQSTEKAKKQTPVKKAQPKQKTRKDKISVALREQVWVQQNGQVFKAKCAVTWCQNFISVFDFQCGHDIPESKGGPTSITNLYPICSRCNVSMSNRYTFQEWCKLYEAKGAPPPPLQQIEETPVAAAAKGWFCCS